jgi:putative transposase
MDSHASPITTASRRRRLPHAVPPWVCTDQCYLLTICTQPRLRNQLCLPPVAAQLKSSLDAYHGSALWRLHVLVLMPDHLHLLATIPPTTDIQRIVVNWKRFVSRQTRVRWQQGFFEHRLRALEHFEAKREYLRQNPVRARLAVSPEEWPFLYEW